MQPPFAHIRAWLLVFLKMEKVELAKKAEQPLFRLLSVGSDVVFEVLTNGIEA